MRCIGLDIHRDFCEVAIAEHGRVRSAGRFSTDPASVEAWARELSTDDLVTHEATGNALANARLIGPFARVILANPKAVKGATALRTKTDKIDARTLATLLAGGFLPEVWIVDEATRILRGKPSKVHRTLAMSSSSRPDGPPARPARCRPSVSGSRPGAARTSRPWPSPASSS